MPPRAKRDVPANEMRDDLYGPPVWPPFDDLAKLLERWARELPHLLRLDTVGRSAEGRPLYAAVITDTSIEDEDKERVLLTALHAGVERNCSMTIFAIMEWLLSSEPLARQIVRRQAIICMPVPNPDCYLKGTHGAVYSDWTLDGPRDAAGNPEAVAVQQVMDTYQPEVHADLHGLSLSFSRYIMMENSAYSPSNLSLRCFHREIVRLMDQEALAEGFPSDQQESDAERLFWGPELDAMANKLWISRPRVYAAIYCYNRYHTLVMISEITWERSGLLRHRRLFEVGNATWPSEYYPGYPVRVVMSNSYHMVVAYGQTAAARRRSRVELWNKQHQITIGMADPYVEGKHLFLCATTPQAAGRWLGDPSLQRFAMALSAHPRIDDAPIREFVAGWPSGQNHPEAFLQMRPNSAAHAKSVRDIASDAPTAVGQPSSTIQHGIALRLRIQYTGARLTDLRLNGHPITRSELDGYVTWVARGFTYVQINIPPQRLTEDDLFIVTCAYDPGERREHWTGWQ